MAKQTVTAIFDDRDNANGAVLLLRRYAIPDRDVTVSPEAAATGLADGPPAHVGTFWAFLEQLFGGTHDHHAYLEGVRRGGIMVTAHVDDENVADVIAILERHGAVDLDERQGVWRAEGWRGGTDGVALPQADTDQAAAGVLATASAEQAYRTASRGKVRLHDGEAVRIRLGHDGVCRIGTEAMGAAPVDAGLGRAGEHAGMSGRDVPRVQRARNMEVVGSDGEIVGIVDHVEGTTIRLKPAGTPPGGVHHLIPTEWVHSVDDKVWLKLTTADARSRWTAP